MVYLSRLYGLERKNVQKVFNGFVRLHDYHGDDESIVRAARVSFGEEPKDEKRDEKLIRYLIKNKHTSPLEHVSFTFHIKCPKFVFDHFVRHRAGSFNVFSQRYTEVKDEFYAPTIEFVGGQDSVNKQGSCDTLSLADKQEAIEIIRGYNDTAYIQYRTMIKLGIARETARMVLPSSVYTQFYWTVNLHNVLHFLHLRLDSHTQAETREYAKAVAAFIAEICPTAWIAFNEYIINNGQNNNSSTIQE